MLKLFSARHRPFHLGPFPLERLRRRDDALPLLKSSDGNASQPVKPGTVGAVIAEYRQLFRDFSDGECAPRKAPIADDPIAAAQDIKAGAYFLDASMVGICALDPEAWTGVDTDRDHDHRFAIAILVEHGREIELDNPAHGWIQESQSARSDTRALEIANVVAGYIRNLGWSARAHDRETGALSQDHVVIRCGLGWFHGGQVVAPFLGTRFGTAVVTTDFPLAIDRPLAGRPKRFDWRYWLGLGGSQSGLGRWSDRRRASHMSRYPMERIKRVASPTTVIHDDEVPRVPKRAAFFERALRGDLGEKAQKERTRFAVKHPFTFAMRGMQAAMVPRQDGPVAAEIAPGTDDPAANARAVKSLCYWMGTDLVGICRIPDYAVFSHKEDGTPITRWHRYAIVLLIDQGYETMEGASGDDWISGSQSMRGYMRGAEITGVVAEHLRSLGHASRAQTNIDSDVLHIPLILLAGLGEMSRIGELVLNPFVGPRFKSAVVTTDMPLAVDAPIDFGLQDMCTTCNKCARECPCDAIPWGDKIMFNGYETWKPDVERCVRYRLTNPKGAACGRCVKTCPYNHEGLLYHRLFLWLAIHVPWTRPWIVRLDDKIGNGRRNPVKKWWRDLEWLTDGYAVEPRAGTNRRDLNPDRHVDPARQKIALYPASAMPVPNDTNPQPIDRKAALAASAEVETPEEARARRARRAPPPPHYTPTPPDESGPRGPSVAVGRSGLAEPTEGR